MKKGDSVYVSPADDAKCRALGQIVIASENNNSMAVVFRDKPVWFRMTDGCFLSPSGLVMLMWRDGLGEAWTDAGSGKAYVIEETV